ncbi:hypothetical protein AABB44_03545 [Bacillus subtilis]
MKQNKKDKSGKLPNHCLSCCLIGRTEGIRTPTDKIPETIQVLFSMSH